MLAGRMRLNKWGNYLMTLNWRDEMRDRYIEEEFPRYFVFGPHHDDGRVDISTVKNSTLATVSPLDAETLIADRAAAVTMICNMARAFNAAAPDDFTKFWYGETK